MAIDIPSTEIQLENIVRSDHSFEMMENTIQMIKDVNEIIEDAINTVKKAAEVVENTTKAIKEAIKSFEEAFGVSELEKCNCVMCDSLLFDHENRDVVLTDIAELCVPSTSGAEEKCKRKKNTKDQDGNAQKVLLDSLNETVDVFQEFEVDAVKAKKVAEKPTAKNPQTKLVIKSPTKKRKTSAKLMQNRVSFSSSVHEIQDVLTDIKEQCVPSTSGETDIKEHCVPSTSGETDIEEHCVTSTGVQTGIKELSVPYPSGESSEEKSKHKKSINEKDGHAKKVRVDSINEAVDVIQEFEVDTSKAKKVPKKPTTYNPQTKLTKTSQIKKNKDHSQTDENPVSCSSFLNKIRDVLTDVKELCVSSPSHEGSEKEGKRKKRNDEQDGNAKKVRVENLKETVDVIQEVKVDAAKVKKPTSKNPQKELVKKSQAMEIQTIAKLMKQAAQEKKIKVQIKKTILGKKKEAGP